MKNFEVKISGSGTKNQIEIRLLELVRNLQTSNDSEIVGTYEDDILICTISE